MFVKDGDAAYKILEIEKSTGDDEVKKAYRRMAMKYHPDKVHHLGPEYQKDAQEKFKKINEAYESVKKQRGINWLMVDNFILYSGTEPDRSV